jgi:hypothetical protein
VLLVLPLSQRAVARWGYPHPRSDAVSIYVVLVCDATLHPCQMVPSKAASMRRATLPAAARGRPQAARMHRVAAACCLLRVVRRTSSDAIARCPLQPPPVVRLASDRVALSQRRASTRLKRAMVCAGRFGSLPRNPAFGTGVRSCSHRHVGIANHSRRHCTARVRMRLSACYSAVRTQSESRRRP